MGAATRNPEKLERHEKNQEIYGEINLEPSFVNSIENEGILQPIVVNTEDTIISGHRRVEAAKEVGLEEVPVLVKEFDSVLEERVEIVHSNKNRTKTFSQKMREAMELERIEKARAKKRQGDRRDITQNFAASAYGESREKVVKNYDMSRETYRKAKKIWEASQAGVEELEEQVEKLDAGEQSIHGAYRVWKEWKELQEYDNPVKYDELHPKGPDKSYKSEQVFEKYRDKLDDGNSFKENLQVLGEGWSAEYHGYPNFETRCIMVYILEKHEYGSLTEYGETTPMTERHPGEDKLEEFYWERGWTKTEIALVTGTSYELIEYWMWKADIPLKFGRLTKAQKNVVQSRESEQ